MLLISSFNIYLLNITHWKNSDAGRDWGQEEKGTTEEEGSEWGALKKQAEKRGPSR